MSLVVNVFLNKSKVSVILRSKSSFFFTQGHYHHNSNKQEILSEMTRSDEQIKYSSLNIRVFDGTY